MIRYALILMIICLFSAAVLAGTYKITHPAYLEQLADDEMQALKEILPRAVDFKEEKYKGYSYFIGIDKGWETVGYIIRAEALGYSSIINMLVGIDKRGNILDVKILSQQETPGLGANVTEIRNGEKDPWFTAQFKGKHYKDLSLDNIQGITAATITSRAVIDGLKKEIEEILPYLE